MQSGNERLAVAISRLIARRAMRGYPGASPSRQACQRCKITSISPIFTCANWRREVASHCRRLKLATSGCGDSARSSTIVIKADSNFALPRRYPICKQDRHEWTVLTVTQGEVSRESARLHRFNSKILSISTGMPIGNVCTPSALRAGSLSCPNNVSKRSLAPLATCGCWVNDCSART